MWTLIIFCTLENRLIIFRRFRHGGSFIPSTGYSHEELEKNLKDIDSRLSVEELDDQVYAEWFYDQLAHNYLPAARCAHLIDQLKLDTDDPRQEMCWVA